MDKETGFPEVGDMLTISGQIISIGGRIVFNKGDKVTVSEVEIREGHYYRPIPDIWIKPELRWVKIEDHYGCCLPGMFEETKQFENK